MSFQVLVKDGQGQRIEAGAVKPAVKQAGRILGCAKSNIHFMSFQKNGGGLDFFLFDSTKADQGYWLAALKRDAGDVLGGGQVPQK